MTPFKVFIRVVKSLINKNDEFYIDKLDILQIPLIYAENKEEVKNQIKLEYPQFFPNNKVYEKLTKDNSQIFYVLIFPLYQHEIDAINEGEWECNYCNHKHENKYISKPLVSNKFGNLLFCGSDYKTGNDIVSVPDCYAKWVKEQAFKDIDLPDDLHYININSLNYIYKITEKSTGKSYIGKTKNLPFFRWFNHYKHSDSPFGLYLRNSKLSDWTFEIIEILPSELPLNEILKKESEYIILYDSINNGFNSLISDKNTLKQIKTSNQLEMINDLL